MKGDQRAILNQFKEFPLERKGNKRMYRQTDRQVYDAIAGTVYSRMGTYLLQTAIHSFIFTVKVPRTTILEVLK